MIKENRRTKEEEKERPCCGIRLHSQIKQFGLAMKKINREIEKYAIISLLLRKLGSFMYI